MTALLVTDAVFERFPEVVLGIVIAHAIDNSGENAEILSLLRREEARTRAELAAVQISQHPQIAPWREAYRAFGSKPKDYPSSIENLARRAVKGHSLPHINTLVDAYNAISLRHLVPVGGEDLDTIAGDVLLAFAGDGEPPVVLLGEPEPRAPHPGEVIYKDDAGAICRRWNWKEADRTKLTAATRHAVLVIEGLPPVGPDLVDRATEELAGLVHTHCGGTVATARIDRGNRAVRLF
jgi:DNA/RNA-binding domain of Phe-tRNA-synthetase-like protein